MANVFFPHDPEQPDGPWVLADARLPARACVISAAAQRFGRRAPAAISMAIVMTLTSLGCRAPRTDQTAMNTEDTGQYEIVGQTQPEPRVHDIHVRVENLRKSTEVARDAVHRTASLSPLRVRIHILGPGDAANAAPRKTIRWPEELDYRAR